MTTDPIAAARALLDSRPAVVLKYEQGLMDMVATLADSLEAERGENQRLRHIIDGVAAAIDTGRNEPLQIWRDQIEIAREDLRSTEVGAP